MRGWLVMRAATGCWGVGPCCRGADPGRVARERRAAEGPVARAWRRGAGYRHRDGSLDGPPAVAGRPIRLWSLCPGGLRSAVRPAPAATADGARDRWRGPAGGDLRPAGGPGRAAAQAEDRRWLSPGRSRVASPAAGGGGRTAPVTAGPWRPPRFTAAPGRPAGLRRQAASVVSLAIVVLATAACQPTSVAQAPPSTPVAATRTSA